MEFVLGCVKESCHESYIPYNKFRTESLPPRFRDHHLMEVIKLIAFLTVRIQVSYTSTARPRFHAGTTREYSRGSTNKRTGTGRIGMVWKYTEKDDRTCPCRACKNSENPRKDWGLIRVITAVHVVYDTSEALQTTCRFGFDSEKSPDVTIEGVDMERADVNDDRCHLACVTHDLQLLNRLKVQWSRYPGLHKKVTEKFDRPDDNLVAIVSHPHGCSKHVSLGSWTHKMTTGESSPGHPYVMYTYTTATCPGSSGATVYIMGRSWGLWYNQIHSGYNGEDNFSGNGCD
ncbi:unnamed protein product [Lymnaea stagnalis]|uniref:Uncharacterized protein n=1 Tax=Lymnaea stagnalis TaxID=6523 RepID=A0AAV2IRP7_LYMST